MAGVYIAHGGELPQPGVPWNRPRIIRTATTYRSSARSLARALDATPLRNPRILTRIGSLPRAERATSAIVAALSRAVCPCAECRRGGVPLRLTDAPLAAIAWCGRGSRETELGAGAAMGCWQPSEAQAVPRGQRLRAERSQRAAPSQERTVDCARSGRAWDEALRDVPLAAAQVGQPRGPRLGAEESPASANDPLQARPRVGCATSRRDRPGESAPSCGGQPLRGVGERGRLRDGDWAGRAPWKVRR